MSKMVIDEVLSKMVIDGHMTGVARILISLVKKDCLYYLSVITPPIFDVVIGMYYSITINN